MSLKVITMINIQMATLAISKPPVPVKTTKKLKKLGRPNDYLSVAERINGRTAMVGFTSALVDEIMTGHSISTQFHDNAGLVVAVSALTFLGTAVNSEDEGYIQGFFEPDKELINGRLAMLGVLSLALTESLHPGVPLF